MSRYGCIILIIMMCLLTGGNVISARVDVANDLTTIKWVRSQLIQLQSRVQSREVTSKEVFLQPEHRRVIQQDWSLFLDYMSVLDQIQYRYSIMNRRQWTDAEYRKVFQSMYFAFLTQYHLAMNLIFYLEQWPEYSTILNEFSDDYSPSINTYSQMAQRFLNVAIATRFARLFYEYHLHSLSTDPIVANFIKQSETFIWESSLFKGPCHTIKQGLRQSVQKADSLWYPIQKQFLLLGKLRVGNSNQYLVTRTQQASVSKTLEPGDILMVKREWHLSNAGIPGFWTHVALYVGTPESRTGMGSSSRIGVWVI